MPIELRRPYAVACISFLLLPLLLVGTASSLRAATVTAMWNANSESDIAGYKLLYGVASGAYTTTIDVGNVTSFAMPSLISGQTYYFVVQAYDTAGLVSPSSAEVSFTVPSAPSPAIVSLSPTSAVVGTAVTIAGANFGATQGTSTVTFNGTASMPMSWAASSILAPVPSGATTGSVVVTVGGVASNAVPFTVVTRAEHHESVADLGRGRDDGDNRRCELRRYAGDEHGDVQRHGVHADELGRQQHRRAGADRGRHREYRRDGRRVGKQRADLYGHNAW